MKETLRTLGFPMTLLWRTQEILVGLKPRLLKEKAFGIRVKIT